ncbi:TM2 domain-containing protein [Brachybacterium sp. YJGR34]|uniref:TM2 domain-containing protein n=1 Tax=Brachybacterium sp. YJGR34 TaxID=2059911 RepID=UPI000E09E571|nr:TM2 domain-containing protein [Brachybacterium sp. YJGR34]
MSTSGEDGSWAPQGNNHGAQDPWARPPAESSAPQSPYGSAEPGGTQDQYGQQNPYGAPSQPAQHGQQDPDGQQGQPAQYGQQDPYGAPSQPAQYGQQDPYGQQGQQDPFGQQSPYGEPSASDPYGQPAQPTWAPAQNSGASASDAYAGGAAYGAGGPAPQGGTAAQGEPTSRLLAGLLGIFLGGFGVHRFLLGYTTIGIIQIVVTVITCGFGAWWGLIEGIMILAKSPAFLRDAHGRPLKD